MTPAQFLTRVRRNDIPPVCLFLGQESYNRKRCREALGVAIPGAGIEEFDASESGLAAIIDEARSMSLFASERLIFVPSAETLVPRASRGAAAARNYDEDDGESPADGGDASALDTYVKNPTPAVVLVFEATRWDFEGEDKAKNDRVRKFFAPVRDVVEFARFNADEARLELDRLSRAANIKLDPAVAASLVEALASDMGRIAVELEKLTLYGKPITAAELPLLVPDARESTVFLLVNALGRRDRGRSLEALDALVREGAYLPLALTFLAAQFRMALVAKETNLRTSSQVQTHFQRAGVQLWGAQAERVTQTASKFSKEQLERGLKLIFETDRDLRSARPDDRTIVENFVVKLCA